MFDAVSETVSESHLNTMGMRHFSDCASEGYQSAILRRNIGALKCVKEAVMGLVAERGKLDILIPASDESVYIPRAHLSDILQEELNFMLAVSRRTSGVTTKRLQIKQAFFRPTHPHNFSVVNSNWNSVGTGIETVGEQVIAGEGDLAYIGNQVLHSSHADLRRNKVTIAVFNA